MLDILYRDISIPRVIYIFAKEHRYMIFKSNRNVSFLPREDNISYVYKLIF